MRIWVIPIRWVFWWCLICITIGLYFGTGAVQWVPAVSTSSARIISGKTVVIDAGHGGIDPGAVSPKGVLEKDITLAIASELETMLHRAAVFVVMVRRSDHDLADSSEVNLLIRKRQDLQKRVDLAEEAKADLFISIHANYFPSSIWSGAQTFFYQGKPEGERLARAIQTELVRHLGPNNRLALSGDYRVLRDTTMPAALIEVGFLSNPREAQLLAQKDYQHKVAAAIFAGIIRYLAN
ncbi:MAG: N-acetylmuramoyl-L-alanine amidase CwlD [Firmicutes bacterium]|jgi:N-acetylmuramoyl-L-alanine amidase|nr:N-acetylmuramoyl-L-alanine amidase CwlD [Bacillota bacterium]